MIKIRDCMKKNVFSVPLSTTILEAAMILRDKHIGSLPVVNFDGKLVGMVTLQSLLTSAMPDFVHLLADLDFVKNFGAAEERLPSLEWLSQPVSSIMLSPTSVQESSGLLHASSLLYSHQLHDLPVVDIENHLVGIVSRVDVGVAFLSRWDNTKKD